MQNPFSPQFGIRPIVQVPRNELFTDYVRKLQNPMSSARSTLVSGVRGSGKTLFLTQVRDYFLKHAHLNVIPIFVTSKLNPVDSFLEGLMEYAPESWLKKAKKQVRVGLDFGFLKLTEADSAALSKNQAVKQLLKTYAGDGQRVLLLMDEVAATSALADFFGLYQVLLQEGFDLMILAAGLPENVVALTETAHSTFLIRCDRIVLGALDSFAMLDAYKYWFKKGNKSRTYNEFKEMVELTKGYAFAFQIIGEIMWTGRSLEDGLVELKDRLYMQSYNLIFRGLSKRDQQYVLALAKTENGQAQEVRKLFGQSANYTNRYRDRLLKTGLIRAVAHGQVAFTLPFFKDFVLEMADKSL